MRPDGLASGQVVAGDGFAGAALLLGVEQAAGNRDGRPAGSDRPPPQLHRRGRGPGGLDPHAGDGAVAKGSAEAGPAGGGEDGCGSRRNGGGLAAGAGQEPLLGSFRPTPREIGAELAGYAIGPQEGPSAARQQDGGHHGDAPKSVGEAAGGHRPDHEGEAEDRDGEEEVHDAHPLRGDRNVEDAPGEDDGGDHQDDGAPALVNGRTAEEGPPHDDS